MLFHFSSSSSSSSPTPPFPTCPPSSPRGTPPPPGAAPSALRLPLFLESSPPPSREDQPSGVHSTQTPTAQLGGPDSIPGPRPHETEAGGRGPQTLARSRCLEGWAPRREPERIFWHSEPPHRPKATLSPVLSRRRPKPRPPGRPQTPSHPLGLLPLGCTRVSPSLGTAPATRDGGTVRGRGGGRPAARRNRGGAVKPGGRLCRWGRVQRPRCGRATPGSLSSTWGAASRRDEPSSRGLTRSQGAAEP